jgi:hypothetical protein
MKSNIPECKGCKYDNLFTVCPCYLCVRAGVKIEKLDYYELKKVVKKKGKKK